MIHRAAARLSKKFLAWLAPQVAGGWQRAREHRHILRFEKRMGLEELKRPHLERPELCVAAGPFAGLKYLSETVCSALLPKLIGSYEAELHEIIVHALQADYPGLLLTKETERCLAVSEFRVAGQQWAFFQAAILREELSSHSA